MILNKQPFKTGQCNFGMLLTILLIEHTLSNTLDYLLTITLKGRRK